MFDPHSAYDVIVCGAGSSGSVVAGRLAENSQLSVLLLEAGGTDMVPAVTKPSAWVQNLRSGRVWDFEAESNPALNGRRLSLPMGKVLGGGSSVNGLMWVRGHRQDWDGYAAVTGDANWGYESVRGLYRRIEDWHGSGEGVDRGLGGPMHIESAPNASNGEPLLVEAASALGIPTFESPNGPMMEQPAGAANLDVIVAGGERQSVFRSYISRFGPRPNLTVLTGSLVTRLIFAGKRISGVELIHENKRHSVRANLEVVVSQGAVQTPKLLMQSGIGDADLLRNAGIPARLHLPGVGKNFQDHVMIFGVMWEFKRSGTVPNGARAILQSTSAESSDPPDIQILQSDGGGIRAEAARHGLGNNEWWSLAPGVVRPRSRGRVSLNGPNPSDGVSIEANHLADSKDVASLVAGIELCRELGASTAMRPFVRREILPGTSAGQLEQFVRSRAVTYWHQAGTSKMGYDSEAVVDRLLQVHGTEGLRVADASILPRIPSANTMAACVVIGERAVDLIRDAHGL